MKRMQCPNCQSWIDQDDASCGVCGHTINQSASTPVSEPAQQSNAIPSIIRAAPQPTQPASSQQPPPNLPPPLVSPSESPITSPPPQVRTVPSSPQAVQSFPKERKGGNCFKIGCGIILFLGFCLLASVGTVYGLAMAGYYALMPDVLAFDLPWIDQSSLEIENYLNTSICYLNVSPSNSDDWGFDLLGASDIIKHGYAYTIYVVPDQKYDIQVLDCDKNELDTVEGVKIGAGGYTYSPGSE